MSADIVIFDNLSEMKRLINSEPFQVIQREFEKERDRYLQKMLNPETPEQETLGLKAVVNALDLMSPKKIAEGTLSRAAKKTKARHPDMFR
jgi:hypothetical protein